MVHPSGPLPVHDSPLCGRHWLASHGVDDSQEQHSQIQGTQNVAQILCCIPARKSRSQILHTPACGELALLLTSYFGWQVMEFMMQKQHGKVPSLQSVAQVLCCLTV